MQPDAHRFVRPDVARYLQPGVDPADAHPALAQERDRKRQAEVRQLEVEIAELAAMRDDLLAMKAEIARRVEALIRARKYSPSQPRVPRGNSDGGQWTSQSRSGGGGGGLFDGFVSGDRVGGDSSGSGALGFADPSSPMGNIDFGDLGGWNESDGLFGITPSETDNSDLVQVVQDSGYSIDLIEERKLGGHTIERHVGKSDESLFNNVDSAIQRARRLGDFVEDYSASSFTSLEAANKLVNSTVSDNPDKVARVVGGLSSREDLDKTFASPTGTEA